MICSQNRKLASLKPVKLYFQCLQLSPYCLFLTFLLSKVVSFTLEQSQFLPQEGELIWISVHCSGVCQVLLHQSLSAYCHTHTLLCSKTHLKGLKAVLKIRYLLSLRHHFQIILHFAPLQLILNFLEFPLLLPELPHELSPFLDILLLLLPQQLYFFLQSSHSPYCLPDHFLLLLNVVAQRLLFFSQSADFLQDIFLWGMPSPELTGFVFFLLLHNFVLSICSFLHCLLQFFVFLPE